MSTTIFIDNKTHHGFKLVHHADELAYVKKGKQYSVELPVPGHKNKFSLVRKSDDSKRITFELSKNGLITKINSNFKVNNLCVGDRLPTGCFNSTNDTCVPIESSVGDGNGCFWGESICNKVWTPPRSVITIGL